MLVRELRTWLKTTPIVALLILASSCATIISGGSAQISVTSEPDGATVYVEPGDFEDTTPAILTLRRKDGPYRLTIRKPGYRPYEVVIKATTNGWVLGNIVVGGIVGIIVDYWTGAATELSPKEVHAALTRHGVRASEQESGVCLFDSNGAVLAIMSLN